MPDVVGTTNYPTSLDTAVSLIEATNNAATILSGGINNSVATITVVSTAAFPTSGVISIEDEIISYTGKTSTTFTGCIRGFDDSAANSHSDAEAVEGRLVSSHLRVLQDAIIATETKLNTTAAAAASGPASSTDEAIARFDTTTGKLLQNSTTTVNDAGAITLPEMSAPATPSAGRVVIYPKSDGKMYRKDDTGTEAELGGGTGAQLNADNTWTGYQTFSKRGTFSEGVVTVAYSPASISSNVAQLNNNYAGFVRLTSSGAFDIYGITAGDNIGGKQLILCNVGSNTLTLKHQHSSATSATNRIITPGGTDYALTADKCAFLIYDGTTDRWRIIS